MRCPSLAESARLSRGVAWLIVVLVGGAVDDSCVVLAQPAASDVESPPPEPPATTVAVPEEESLDASSAAPVTATSNQPSPVSQNAQEAPDNADVSTSAPLAPLSQHDVVAHEEDPIEAENEPSYPRVQVGGRLIAGAHRERTHPGEGQNAKDSRQPFFLKQARLKVSASLNKWLKLAISADMEATPGVRNAFANVRLKRYLQFRAGRFKRPMSRLELTSIGRLPFIDRGLANHALIEKAGWGDRALGAMAHGKIKGLRLRYYAGVMNASPSVGLSNSVQLRGADFLGRVQWSPNDVLSVGVNGGHKTTEVRVDGTRLRLNAIGADATIKLGQLRWLVESMAAQNPYAPVPPLLADRTPWALYVVSYMQYDARLDEHLVLQPVILGEWVDPDLDYSNDEAVRGLLGVNLVWHQQFRLMPYVEVTRPIGTVSARSFLASETYAIALSLQI